MTQNNGNASSSGGSASSMCLTPGEERLTVAVRIRPSNESNEQKCVHVTSKKTLLFDDGSKTKPMKYVYDHVFGEDSSQEEVYVKTTAPLVKDVLSGLNAAAFAYGATGSGKTHTMLGPNPKKAATPQTDTAPKTALEQANDGLMVRAIAEIFEFVEKSDNSEAIRVSKLKENLLELTHPPHLPAPNIQNSNLCFRRRSYFSSFNRKSFSLF
ncbi:Kinesin motor domain-containing protein [Sergentomyia squamirostris]